jgi:hypothetical protein
MKTAIGNYRRSSRSPRVIVQINNFVEISDGTGEHDCSASSHTRNITHCVARQRFVNLALRYIAMTCQVRRHVGENMGPSFSPLRPRSSPGFDLLEHSSAISAVVVVVNQPVHATSEPVSPIMAAEGDF